MKKFNLAFIIILCFNFAVKASSNVDTIKITSPTYFSAFEQENFEAYLHTKKVDILSMSLAIDSSANENSYKKYLKNIHDYLNTNKSSIEKAKKEKSKITKIVKTSGETFFSQYDINAYCSDFYAKGKFNCVTGSIYFSLIMDSLNIPYAIKEKPTHVFLLAYPNTFSMPIESTDPNMTIFIPDESFKRKYVDYLAESKFIQKSDIASKGVENIFNENYYSNKDISQTEAIGLLYFNSGISHMGNTNFKLAFQQFEKSYLLYPSERIKYVLQLSLIAFLGDMGTFNLDHLNYLAKLANYSKSNIYDNIVTEQFKSYTNKYLINENDELKYEQIYNKLISLVEDSTVKSDISTVYYYERSRVCAIKNEYDKSRELICKGYKINPKNLDLTSILQNSFISMFKSIIYNNNFINQYDSIMTEFPVLRNNLEIQMFEGVYYLNKAQPLFNHNNIAAGEKMMKKFDDFMVRNPNCTFYSDYIARVYSSIASAYYRNKNLKKCKAAIERGFVFAPNNDELVRLYKINITHEIR